MKRHGSSRFRSTPAPDTVGSRGANVSRAVRAAPTRNTHDGAICNRSIRGVGNSVEKIHAPEQGRGGRSGYATVNAPPPRLDGGVNDIVCKPVLANPLNLRGRKSPKSFMEPGRNVKK